MKVTMNGEVILEFKDFIFREKLNVTVRRGTKWSGIHGDVILASADDPKQVKRGFIHKTIVYQFEDIPQKFLDFEHIESARTRAGLLEGMIAAYGDFDELEIVTVVLFEVLGD